MSNLVIRGPVAFAKKEAFARPLNGATVPLSRPGGGFGERLNEALRHRGVRKLYPLALELGVDESALSRWRKGGAISLDRAIRLAEHLDVSLDWLLTGRGGIDAHKAAPPLTAEDRRLLEALRTMRDRLPPHALVRLIDFIEAV